MKPIGATLLLSLQFLRLKLAENDLRLPHTGRFTNSNTFGDASSRTQEQACFQVLNRHSKAWSLLVMSLSTWLGWGIGPSHGQQQKSRKAQSSDRSSPLIKPKTLYTRRRSRWSMPGIGTLFGSSNQLLRCQAWGNPTRMPAAAFVVDDT